MKLSSLLASPKREYLIIGSVLSALALSFFVPPLLPLLLILAFLGGIPTAWEGLRGLMRLSITIEVFNFVALSISFITGEYRSAAFIVLMLASASILEWRTQSRTQNAVAELLALEPRIATCERGGKIEEIKVEDLVVGDIIVITSGARVPADGIVIQGSIFMSEAPVTGESVLVMRSVGDIVLSGTLGDSGVAKVRVTQVGKESTLERMAALIAEAVKNKSKTERIADRFATIFLPVVLVLGAATYYFTRDASMTAALLLVACADDMAVAIPLAVSAVIGSAAKRGVVVKGGEWLAVLSKVRSVVLDKTGTLTYGNFAVSTIALEGGADEKFFWRLVGSAEKYSEHPVGRALFKESLQHVADIPEYEEVRTLKGTGVAARVEGHEIILGDAGILEMLPAREHLRAKLALSAGETKVETVVLVSIDGKFCGSLGVADIPRPEARASLTALREAGIKRIAMFTGDNEQVAKKVSKSLGIDEVWAALLPDEKLTRLATLPGPVAMVGDGINDAPALARSDVGIAMGGGGTAVAVEAANIVFLTDNLARLPEMFSLSKRIVSVIHWDIIIWALSNLLGFVLVLTGFLGPAFAALYNFLTDFLPLINSSRLFRESK